MAKWDDKLHEEITRGTLITAEEVAAWLAAIRTRADKVYRNYCNGYNSSDCGGYNSSDNSANQGVWTSNYTVKGK